jgi:hypothetical protein
MVAFTEVATSAEMSGSLEAGEAHAPTAREIAANRIANRRRLIGCSSSLEESISSALED